ncbi:MAG: right-handed parallel beta-helix repeat-containing protein [Planctomycetota bacterium]|jgi:parallel beta-helix repeat protein
MEKRIWKILLAVVVSLAVSGLASAETHLVPNDYETIQQAIDAAVDGDTVVVADGTYTGDGNRDIDFKGKAIMVKSENGPENCIIDCNGTYYDPHRGFYFHNSEGPDSVLNGFTITNGYAYGQDNNRHGGGAIRCDNSSPVINNCIIKNNSAAWDGGGINNYRSAPTINNCVFIENSAIKNDGGAINNYRSNPIITNCTFINNSAYDWGGGIRNVYSSNPVITNCLFSRNVSDEGGGIFNYDNSNPTILNCTFCGNSAPTGGSVVYNQEESYVTVINSIVWDNVGSEIAGGGYNISYSNIEDGYPGEGNIDIDPGFAFSTDCHLIRDSACIDAGTNTPAGGLTARDIDGNPRVLDGNGDGTAVVDMGAYEFNPNSPSIALSTIRFSYIQGDLEFASQALLIRNCGGGTLNWEIAEDCDWLEAAPTNGVSTGLINEVILTADSNGLPIGDYSCVLMVCDANAINSPRTVTVDLRICAQVIYVPSQAPTIQYAIDYVFEAGTVIVEDGTYTGEGNRDIDFLGKPITVRSENGPENCIIDCEGTEQEHHRGFLLTDCRNQDENQILSGFTVMNGYANYGGGIYCLNSSATINNCIISENTAGNDFGGNGGGIYCRGWDDDIFTITDCIISGNSAKSRWAAGGGGVCFGGTLDGGGSTFIMTNCTITENTVEGEGEWSSGGSLYCGGEGTRYGDKDATFKISNCTIRNNTGSGIYCEDSNPIINNCSISGNTGRGSGGIWCWFSDCTISNSTISGNTGSGGGPGRGRGWFGGRSCGGISVMDGIYFIYNCTISGNTGEEDGGISCGYSDCTISNCTISGNTASGGGRGGRGGPIHNGGGISVMDGIYLINNCTISGNSAENGSGGIACSWGSNTTISNSVLWGNKAPDGPEIYLSSGQNKVEVQVSYSNVQGGQNSVYAATDSTLSWGPGNIDADPCFVEPGLWDGDLWIEGDYHLQPWSACIDAGDPYYVPGANETDLDGLARVFGGRVDMGAYEFSLIESRVWIFPQVINRHSRNKRIMAWIALGEDVSEEQIDEDEPVLLYPGGIGPIQQRVFPHGRGRSKRIYILAFYDKEKLLAAVSKNGAVELEVMGRLKSGRYFGGCDSIRIKRRGRGRGFRH